MTCKLIKQNGNEKSEKNQRQKIKIKPPWKPGDYASACA